MPLSGYNLKPIDLPKATKVKLGGVCTELVSDLEDCHARHFDNIRVWWKWYEAEPKTTTKNHPWPNSSNIVAPVIRTQADARTAQDFSLLWGTKDRFYSGKSENEQFTREYQGPVMSFLNRAMASEVKPFWPLLESTHERNVLGCSVLSVSWDDQYRYIFAPNSKKPERVCIRKGVKWEHHPAETILWEPGTPIRESDRVIVQRLVNPGDIARKINGDQGPGYDKDALLKLLQQPHLNGSPGAEVRAEKETRAGVDPMLNVSRRPIYDTRVLWLDWPMLGGLGINGLTDLAVVEEEETGERTRVPIIVELAHDTGEVLRVLPNPYLMADGNPWFDTYYRRQVGYARGIGLAKILEGMQRAQSTIVNQAIDGRTLQNAMPFKTTDPKLKERPITPGQGLYLANMGDAERFDIPNASPVDLALANLMQVFAERAGGANDPMLGRESRSGGHPSPATNYMGQLQQSAKMGSVPTFTLDEQLSAAGLYTASLYQQFDTDDSGRIQRIFGAGDAAKINEWLFPNDMSLVGTLQLSLTALSEDSPQQAMQRAMFVSQATQAYFGNILKLIQVLSMPTVPPPVKKAAIQAVKVLGDTHQTFLEAASFDEAHEAILRLDQGDLSAIQQLQQLAAQAGASGQPGAGGEGGGAGPSQGAAGIGGNGAVPNGASGPPQPGAAGDASGY